MLESVSFIIPYTVLAGHVLFAMILVALVFRRSWGRGVATFFGKHALMLAFLVSLAAVLGSIFYSNIVGYEPCVLCWWQRVCIFPSALILGIAAWKRDANAFRYVVPLIVASFVIAAYQYYSTVLGGSSLLACTDAGGACSRIYVKAFGYITIEFMSLTASAFILLFAWAGKVYRDESR